MPLFTELPRPRILGSSLAREAIKKAGLLHPALARRVPPTLSRRRRRDFDAILGGGGQEPFE